MRRQGQASCEPGPTALLRHKTLHVQKVDTVCDRGMAADCVAIHHCPSRALALYCCRQPHPESAKSEDASLRDPMLMMSTFNMAALHQTPFSRRSIDSYSTSAAS